MTDVPECMSIQWIQQATAHDEHLQHVKCFIITDWLDTRDQLYQDIRPYWLIKDDMSVIDGVTMKGRCITIPKALQQQALNQLHVNDMGIEKTNLLTHILVYWVNINNDIKNYIKNCTFQQMQPKEKIIHHDIPIRPWDVVGTDRFHINNKNYLCITVYHSKLPVVKKTEGLSADNLIAAFMVVFSEYGIPKK